MEEQRDAVEDQLAIQRPAPSHEGVDRSAARRAEPGLVNRLLADPTTRVLTLADGRVPTAEGALDLRPPRPGDEAGLVAFLGEDRATGTAYLMVDGAQAPDESEQRRWAGLRELGALLDDAQAGLLTAATALSAWHAGHRFCPRCGHPTEIEQGGWARRCPQDGTEHHPRTDPAVIMAVTDADDRLLLGAGARWPERRMSVLAGFVEAGEALEAAVVREVAEEVGLVVEDVTYLGNQPWPFPASLMLAFRARATTTQLRLDVNEIREARWVTREELAPAVASGEITLPGPVSIARRMIDAWHGSPLTEPTA